MLHFCVRTPLLRNKRTLCFKYNHKTTICRMYTVTITWQLLPFCIIHPKCILGWSSYLFNWNEFLKLKFWTSVCLRYKCCSAFDRCLYAHVMQRAVRQERNAKTKRRNKVKSPSHVVGNIYIYTLARKLYWFY